MNKSLLLAFTILTTLTSNAFANHAYRSQSCTSEKFDLAYLGNYPVGGMYGLSPSNSENQVSALPSDDTVMTDVNAEVIFTELSSVNIGEAKESKDCDFDHTEWKSKKVIEMTSVSAEAAKIGLKQGDKITFICEETLDYPNGVESCL